MKNLKMTTFLFTILVFFCGCYQDNLIFTPDDTEDPPVMITGNIDDFFSNVQEELDSFQFKAENGFQFVTENQTVIEAFGNSFIDSDGNIVEGNIDFKYIEILNPSEYAFYNLPTISGGKRLRTEGVFRFEAYQDGKSLQLKQGKTIIVKLPDNDPEEGMEVFYGEGSGEEFDWVLQGLDTGTDNGILITEWFSELDSANQEFIEGFGYLFECDLFTWINVDIFANIPENEKTEVCVELPDQYGPENTAVFMFFNGEKSILALYPDADEMKWCEPYGATPIGYTVTIFTISSLGDDIFHFGIEEVVVSDELTVFIEPEEKSLQDIIKSIKELE